MGSWCVILGLGSFAGWFLDKAGFDVVGNLCKEVFGGFAGHDFRICEEWAHQGKLRNLLDFRTLLFLLCFHL